MSTHPPRRTTATYGVIAAAVVPDAPSLEGLHDQTLDVVRAALAERVQRGSLDASEPERESLARLIASRLRDLQARVLRAELARRTPPVGTDPTR